MIKKKKTKKKSIQIYLIHKYVCTMMYEVFLCESQFKLDCSSYERKRKSLQKSVKMRPLPLDCKYILYIDYPLVKDCVVGLLVYNFKFSVSKNVGLLFEFL